MRSAVSLVLAISLIGSALPVKAQRHPSTAGPIARSISREAERLAAMRQNQPVDPEWSRVRHLAPGTELIVTIKDSQPAPRRFVMGDESDLLVLNLNDPALPAAARDVLSDIASTHPEYFPAAEKGGRFVLARDVAVGPDGVFVAGRKVADLVQVIERYRRPDIIEIATASVESNPLGCAFAGYFMGALVGGLPGSLVGGAVIGDTGGALQGMMVGWAIGGVLMYRRCRHSPEKVLYRAPYPSVLLVLGSGRRI